MRGIEAGAIGFGVYVGDCYHADDAALVAMDRPISWPCSGWRTAHETCCWRPILPPMRLPVRSCEGGAGKRRTGG